MGKSQRTKGRAFEQKIARVLREVLPTGWEVKRNIQSQSGVVAGSDISVKLEGEEEVTVSIECKHARRINYIAALEQAEGDAPGNSLPVVVAKKHAGRTLAVMSWENFVWFLAGMAEVVE